MRLAAVGVDRFEDLRVWQAAKGFSDAIGGLIRRPTLQNDFALRDQLNAAALSIAEGFARGGRKEFHYFVRYRQYWAHVAGPRPEAQRQALSTRHQAPRTGPRR